MKASAKKGAKKKILHPVCGDDLAICGGPKAVEKIEARGRPKVGVEEFISLAERFGYSRKTLKKIRDAISAPGAGGGAFLGRYYGESPIRSGPRFEQLAREKFGVRFAMPVNSSTYSIRCRLPTGAVKVQPGKNWKPNRSF